MKIRLSLALLFLLPSLTFAAPETQPVVLKGPHYTVTSWAGAEAGQTTLDLMEALVVRYNSLFLFDLSLLTSPWNVTLYATKADFDKALTGQIPAPATDYVYLHYSDPARSQLAAWVPEEGTPIDEARSLAFQGFFQFFWTFVPHPPAWIETGLASVFWNSKWDGKKLTSDSDLLYLETLQERWKDKGPDVRGLLTAAVGSLTAASGRDLEAWGLAAFLLESPDPNYARLFGSALANLSSTASEEANRDAVLQRFLAAKDPAAASTDIQTWWKLKTGFKARLDQGVVQLKDKNYLGAATSFSAALALRPLDDAALYYSGLAAYESKDYAGAESYFSRVNGKTLPPGLLPYARGLTAFALKKNDAAKTWLAQARTEDEATYGRLVLPVLDLVR